MFRLELNRVLIFIALCVIISLPVDCPLLLRELSLTKAECSPVAGSINLGRHLRTEMWEELSSEDTRVISVVQFVFCYHFKCLLFLLCQLFPFSSYAIPVSLDKHFYKPPSSQTKRF